MRGPPLTHASPHLGLQPISPCRVPANAADHVLSVARRLLAACAHGKAPKAEGSLAQWGLRPGLLGGWLRAGAGGSRALGAPLLEGRAESATAVAGLLPRPLCSVMFISARVRGIDSSYVRFTCKKMLSTC